MSGPTPGPWKVLVHPDPDEPERSEVHIGHPPADSHCGKHVARLCGWGADYEADPEMQANAALIAAAPDLLAALETLSDIAEDLIMAQALDGFGMRKERGTLALARAALAKVRP